MKKAFLFLGFNKGEFNAAQAISVIGAADKKAAKEIALRHLTTPQHNAGWAFDTRDECVARGDKECAKHTVIDLDEQRNIAGFLGLRAA